METERMNADAAIRKLTMQRDRNYAQFSCAYNWLGLLEQGTDLIPYFRARQCSRIAIYGAAALGGMLCKELCRAGLSVSYFMDRNAEDMREKDGIPVYLPEELPQAPEADMMIVTAVTAFKEISRMLLRMKPELPVVSLETVINVRMCEEWK